MLDILQFLSGLRNKKITISLTDKENEIIVRGSIKNLTNEEKIFISSNKDNIIRFFQIRKRKKYLSIPIASVSASYPISDAQRRLWVLSQFKQGNISYNIDSRFDLEGNYDVNSFSKAVHAVIDRHEILRTVFRVDENGEVRQWILEASSLNFQIDFQDYRYEPKPESKVIEYIDIDRIAAFDLEKGPLLRAALLRVSDSSYVFYYNMHHIISDGWSMNVLSRDVLAYYDAFLNSGDLQLPSLRIQYKDYSLWQLSQLNQENYNLDRSYWLEQLSGDLPVLDLPSFNNRPSLKTYRGRRLQCYLPSSHLSGLKDIGQKRGGTLFMGIIASLNALFYRYSGQSDIVLGTPVAGRDRVDLEDQIGFYVNTLVLRNNVNGADSFNMLFDRVKDTMLNAYAHQYYPFDRLVDDLGIRRDVSRSVIFDVMVGIQNNDQVKKSDWQFTGDIEKIEDLGSSVSKFDISIDFQELDEVLSLVVEYNEDVYDKTFIEGFTKHYRQLLDTVFISPDKSLDSLDFLNDIEKEEQLFTFNDTVSEYPFEKTIVELFEEQVKRTPDHIAVVFEGKEITYQELNEQSNQLSHYLLEKYSIAPGDLVGIKLDRSEWLVVSILGILKTGAAYVPIDPGYPESRISYIESDSSCQLIIDNAELSKFKANSINYSIESAQIAFNSESLIYVIYTSGSTGNPKGCLVTHKNVVRLLINDKHPFDFRDDDVWIMSHSIHFDFSVWEVFGPILCGAKLIIPTEESRRDFKRLSEQILKNKVTVLNQTPLSFKLLSEYILDFHNTESLDSLRYVIFGGDKLEPSFLEKWISFYPLDKVQLINMYGITETTVHVTYYSLSETDIREGHGRSIVGTPLPETKVYILNSAQLFQPRGVPGEIYVGGSGLAQGYLHKPQLTAERFIDTPFLQGARIYKTGDLGRWLPDGNIEFLGRIDDQVKIRGYRIELGEIEYHLLNHNSIKQAVVVSRINAHNEGELVAYLVCDAGGMAEIRDYLRGCIPSFMIPSHFIELDLLPLTSSGKVDKKLLPLPVDVDMSSEREFVAPGNDTEQELVEIWQEVLGRDKISITDNFFGLGGDSIKSMLIVARIRKNILNDFNIDSLYKNQTISELSAFLSTVEKNDLITDSGLEQGLQKIALFENLIISEDEMKQILPSKFEGIYPLTENEQGMIYSSLIRPDEPVYYDQFRYNLVIRDLVLFRSAIGALVQRHPILRSKYYINTYSEPLKVILEEISIPFDVEDLSHYSLDYQKKYVNNYIVESNKVRYVFEGDILWKMKVFKLNNNECEIIWDVHHALLDGWSVSTFLLDLSYLLTKGTSKLSPLQTTYREFSAYQTMSADSENKTNFWKNLMQGYVRNKLPFNYNGHIINGEREMKKFSKDVDNLELLKVLDEITGKYNVSFKSICLSAYLFLLKIVCKEIDVVAGLVSHNRPQVIDSEKVLGNFLNTVPIRINFDEVDNFLYLINQVNNYLISFKHNDIHLSKIAKAIGDKTSGRNPIFDCIFNYTNFHSLENWNADTELEAGDSTILDENSVPLNEMTNTLFDLEVDRSLNKLSVSIKYIASFFADSDIEYAVALYIRILESMVEDIKKPISSLILLSNIEQNKLLYDFNSTAMEYSNEKTLVELLEIQVLNAPDDTALVQGSKIMTYGELNAKSNQLAELLIEKGIKHGDNIGLISSRTFDMIIGMYGILKSGGAYVPIDPEYPVDRQKHIINNSKVTLLLVDEKYPLLNDFEKDQFIFLDCQDIKKKSTENLKLKIDSKNLAYTIYTSGSTGLPKGVMIEHHSVINLIEWVNTKFNVNKSDRLLLLTSMCFDLSVYDIFGILSAGATLVLAEKKEIQDIEKLKKLLLKERITFWNSVPSTMSYLIEELDDSFYQEHLRIVFLSGDRIPVNLPDKIKRFFPNAVVVSLGGATEGTVWSNYYIIDQVSDYWKSIPYGRPIQNNFFYILDSHLQPVPKGVAGDLYIGGVGVAQGYANDKEKSSMAFLPDPFNREWKGMMYKTGDLGRMLPDWNIEFLGRDDNQIKIRGYRVEIGEIENVILNSGYYEAAVVSTFQDNKGNNQLAAYLVSQYDFNITDIKDYLANYLPSYMIPNFYYKIEKIPLTNNGKIDRSALPKPKFYKEEKKDLSSSKKTALEIDLADIWMDLLYIEDVENEDDFFDLGGTSLLIGSLINRVLKKFSVKLEIIDVFKNSTFEGILEIINNSKKTRHLSIDVIPISATYPISDAQRRLWVLSQFEQGNISYNMYSRFDLSGHYDVDSFCRAVHAVIDRHEILRTVFHTDKNGEVRQLILDASSLNFQIDYKDYRYESEPEFKVNEYIDKDRVVAFDLEKGPLLRAALLQVSDSGYVFYHNMHHIISDGWSMNILSRDVLAYYNAFYNSTEVLLPSLRIQYKDYSSWQLNQLDQEIYNLDRLYWLEELSGNLPVLDLPSFKNRPSLKTYRGRKLQCYIPSSNFVGLKDIGHTHGGTLFMGVMASLNALFYRYTGQSDIILGTPVAGRYHIDLEDQIGFYVNTLALRNSVNGAESFNALYTRVKETMLNAYTHQYYPFDRLVDELDVRRDVSRSVIFDVMVGIQNTDQGDNSDWKFSGDLDKIEDMGSTVSKFDLSIDFQELGDVLSFAVEFNEDIYDKSFIEGFMRHYRQLLDVIVTNPDKSLDSLDFLNDIEREEQLLTFNDTISEYPSEKTIVELFEEQVKRTPDHTAIVFEGSEITYQELNEKSNQLSHYLLEEYSIAPGDLVGIKLDRSEWLVVSILGILKTGGAYVPIDPEYPESRISYIESDSNCQLIIDNAELSKFKDNSSNYSRESAKITFNPDSLIYVIYTSGSTGNPKGCLVTHKNVVRLLINDKHPFDFKDDDVWIMCHSIHFDFSVWEVFGPMLYGAKLIIPTEESRKDFKRLSEQIFKHKVTVLNQTPMSFKLLSEYILDFYNTESLDSLRYVIFGGDKLEASFLEKWMSFYPLDKVQLINMYGITETTVHVTYYRMSEADILEGFGKSIVGTPLPETEIYILNNSQLFQPRGVPGEIYVGGSGLARGYLNKPELTAERFVCNPFLEGTRIYKTGDLGRWLPDGNIEFIGRIDDQVKIRGYRIELGEIEYHLLNHNSIKEAIVISRINAHNEGELVAYLVCDAISMTEIRDYLRGCIPSFMVPSHFVELDLLPLTSSGKVDKKLLPLPFDVDMSSETQYVAPRNDTEQELVEIWQEVLGRDRIGINDNFFELGGHSLNAIVSVQMINQRLNIKISLTQFFTNSTIDSLGKVIISINGESNFIEVDSKKRIVL